MPMMAMSSLPDSLGRKSEDTEGERVEGERRDIVECQILRGLRAGLFSQFRCGLVFGARRGEVKNFFGIAKPCLFDFPIIKT